MLQLNLPADFSDFNSFLRLYRKHYKKQLRLRVREIFFKYCYIQLKRELNGLIEFLF